MKFFSRRLATLVAIASVTCLVSMRSVLGQEAPDAVNPSSQEYEALTNGHKKHHHHHHGGHPQHGHHHRGGQHHHKHHGKHHHGKPHRGKHHHKKPRKKPHHPKPPKVEIAKKIYLVCDGFIIDKIACPRKTLPIIMFSAKEDQATFQAQNNVKRPEQVYIVMDSPCSKDLPANCAAASALDA
ncbi:hypothetical protein BGX30_010809 [Mortierella sp. GBA39]|nr:hypothetical protein BGX30_010809 [Mortierella sp. GBA39]